MFTDNDLRELLEFVSSDPVLSLYLNTDPTQGNADAYRLRLRTMLKEVNLEKDVAAVERYFSHEYGWAGKSVAVFSCAAQGFFRAFPLAIPVRNLCHVSDRPSVKPLADLLDNYGGYGVVLVDKQGARLFFFHLGELREHEGILGEVVKHTKRGGASSFPGRRGGVAGRTNFEEEKIERNMRETADFAVHFFEENHIRRILIGGTEENVHLLKSMLPKAWQSLVMGTFAMAMTASQTEVLNKALQLGLEAERQREQRHVDELVTLAAKGNQAVVGLTDTLLAISQGKVKTLTLVEGLRKDGYLCPSCGALSAQMQDPCTQCGLARMERTLDVVDLAVHSVMRRGGEVTTSPTNSTLEQVGSIGALLRY